ncbi:hypothetical protein ECO2947_23855 [Escherichia coli]|nr:hypothetical protein ECO1752_23610 [Escherichia coli]CAK5469136.1 hypothetical protein ECO2947_23855 [Escherichia coli]
MGNYTSALLLLARLMLACLYMISGVPKLLSFTGTIDKMASLGLIFPAITAAIVVLVEIVGALMIVFGFFTRTSEHYSVPVYRVCFISWTRILDDAS